jgi:hypothetical protein
LQTELACPICGQLQLEAPWRAGQGSQEICSLCGVQFGYSDMAGGDESRRRELWGLWRAAWIRNGHKPLSKQQVRQLLDAFFGRTIE